MSKPFIIENGRFRLLYSDGALRLDMDGGNGLIFMLTEEQRKRLSKALWYQKG